MCVGTRTEWQGSRNTLKAKVDMSRTIMAVRDDSGEERVRVFLSIPVASEAVYVKAKQATAVSISILLLCLCSLITGLLGKRYFYSLAANLMPVLFPIIVYESLQQKLWGLDLLRSQCLVVGVYGLTLLILDAIILAYTATSYRYCYGSWTDQCEDYQGNGNFDLVCKDSQANSESPGLFVTCYKPVILHLQLVCLILNLLHCFLVLPYLCLCYGLRSALRRTGWETGTIMLDFPSQVISDVASKAIVILGNREEEGDDLVLEGSPVPQKDGSSLEESREEVGRGWKATDRP